jgi:predicted LPLAT superfamily acyltransferase
MRIREPSGEESMRSTGRLLGGIMLAAAVGGFGLMTVRRMRASRERLATLRRRADAAARREAEAADAGADELLAAW